MDKDKGERLSYLSASSSSSLSASSSSSGQLGAASTSSLPELPSSATFVQLSEEPTSGVISNYVEDLSALSKEFSESVIGALRQIGDEQIVNVKKNGSLESLVLFAAFEKVAHALEKFDNKELSSKAKQNVQSFLAELPWDLDGYIQAYLDGEYRFERVLKKLKLKIDNLSLCQQQALYIVYELENIFSVLAKIENNEYAKTDGLSYDDLLQMHFREIDAVLKIINVDKLEMRYKVAINKLIDYLLLKVGGYENFYSNLYNVDVLKNMGSLFIISKKKKAAAKNHAGSDDKNEKKPEGIFTDNRSSFSNILGSLPSASKYNNSEKELPKQISTIVAALERIKKLIPDATELSDSKESEDLLKAQFGAISESLKPLDSLTFNGYENYIYEILAELRSIIDQRQFDKFYYAYAEMAEILFVLESKCIFPQESAIKKATFNIESQLKALKKDTRLKNTSPHLPLVGGSTEEVVEEDTVTPSGHCSIC